MKLKLTLKQSLLILVGAGVLLILLLNAGSSSQILPKDISYPEEGRQGLPVRFKIPRINVDAAVENVGLTSEGAMEVPAAPQDVAWYQRGPRPGEPGSSVIAGHSGYKDNQSAVFDNLYKLKKGDKIYIKDSTGEVVTFIVRELKSYDRNESVPEVFFSDDGLSHLNLVTCTGVWSVEDETRSDRLVVFTDKEIK